MRFPPLIEGTLLRRYKRFLADVQLASGEVVTAAVANTGSMLGLADPGMTVYLSADASGARKLGYSWLLVRCGRNLVCVDTSVPNRVVAQALRTGAVSQLAGYREVVAEMPLGSASRADFCLRVHTEDMLSRCWVEVKAVSMAEGRIGLFPDAVTQRGRKHLEELTGRIAHGDRAMLMFFVQRGDCHVVRPAERIDPAYAAALRAAVAAGVEVLALQARVTQQQIVIARPVPVEL
jgi:sugar fermentation stimulation protein A